MNVLYNFWTQEPKLQQWTRRIWATFVLHAKISHNNGKFVSSAYRKPTFSSVLLIIKAQFQCTQNEDFYTYYFKGVLMYAVISRHFIRRFIIWRLMSEKTVILRILWIYVLSHFWLLFIQLKFFFRMYLKGMFLLSCRSLEVLRFKIERDVFCQVAVPWKYFVSNSKETSKVISRSPVWVEKLFTFKDKWSEELLLRLRNYKCGGWNATYYGKTKCYFKVRICELLVI